MRCIREVDWEGVGNHRRIGSKKERQKNEGQLVVNSHKSSGAGGTPDRGGTNKKRLKLNRENE